MKMISSSLSILKSVGIISQAIIMAVFLTAILAVDALATIPTKWLLN